MFFGSYPGWHPLIIHFVIGLLLTGVVAWNVSKFAKKPRTVETAALIGTWNVYIGTLGALLAVGTGLAAAFASTCRTPQAMHAVSLHFRWAFATLLLFLVVAVGRLAENAADAAPSAGLLTLAILGAMCLCVTAYLGSENVYVHGIGVLRACAAAAP